MNRVSDCVHVWRRVSCFSGCAGSSNQGAAVFTRWCDAQGNQRSKHSQCMSTHFALTSC